MQRPRTATDSPMLLGRFRKLRLPLLAAVAGLFACGEDGPPLACGVIQQQTVFVGEPLALQPCFEDPDGETLTLRASSSDATVARVTVQGSEIIVEALSIGSSIIAVVATDPDAMTAEQKFEVLVPNRPPAVCESVPQQQLYYRQTKIFEPCFEDPENQGVTLSVSSSDVEVAVAEVFGTAVMILARSPGTATIAIVATDPGSLTAQLDVEVLVPNRPPLTRGSPGPAEVVEGESMRWRLGDYFQDPDDQQLTYGASSENPEIATASVVDVMTLIVTGVAAGSTTVTAKGTDPGGLSATIDFPVTVSESGPGERILFVTPHPSPLRSSSATAGWRAWSRTP